MAENSSYVRIIKTTKGALSLKIYNPSNGIAQPIFINADDTAGRLIPLASAAYIYANASGGAYLAYKKGFFTFDDCEKVYQYALEHGLVFGSKEEITHQSVSVSYLKDIEKELIDGNRTAIEARLKTDKGKDDVVQIAHDNLDKLKMSFVEWLEKRLDVSLRVEKE